MPTVKEQMTTDLNYVLGLDETAENAVLLRKDDTETSCRISIIEQGDTESELNGRLARICSAVLPKSEFSTRPQPHDTIKRADNSLWIVDGLIGETPVSWTIRIYSEIRVK